MVLLTVTPSILEALQCVQDAPSKLQRDGEPSLSDANIGAPISHGQIMDLWNLLKAGDNKKYSLEILLRGSRVYVPPPPPKPEPSDEYKALMARLCRDEEERAYERMINPVPPMETFSQRFPSSAGMARAFAEANRPTRKEDMGDDDVTYDEVHRQLMLIFNFMVTILGVAATLWILARWWSTPARIFLTMGGSIIAGVAEVALYSGYVWHLGQAKKKDKTFKEVKEVVQTWVVGPEEKEAAGKPIAIEGKESTPEDTNLRRRKK
ncbi:endoplasmic reticulum-based factor for assembly of V-ATPase-domain-containing protein [Neurospora tetraspora]|uniref:Endoplasmic reticulum-based factor for assembly of V-ATPase-domain-containing protein n=1 Tax=Neurospora tetraspora TaxID=94610 RepID=A0AAE0JI79_9PEZI|nr:endoplasmic reticulum-based factor for assembly of V-ATPase-domain-containing protein [Neurospora tetraspora]